MGDPRKQHKTYVKPKRPFDKARIDEEASFIKKYGLKNKREIWKADSYIRRIRTQARKLIMYPEQQTPFFNKLLKLGLINKDASIDDVLALSKEKLFERRFQTIVFKKGIVKTIKQSRQLIVHRKIKIAGQIVDVPSYLVSIEEETKISLLK